MLNNAATIATIQESLHKYWCPQQTTEHDFSEVACSMVDAKQAAACSSLSLSCAVLLLVWGVTFAVLAVLWLEARHECGVQHIYAAF